MVQMPSPLNVTVPLDTEQTADGEAVYVIAKPELAVAFRLSGVPTTCELIAPKLIVCACLFTVKLCVTDVAAE